MNNSHACGSASHLMHRRRFLADLGLGAAGAATLGIGLPSGVLAAHLRSAEKRILVVYLAGGSSQLETWDPKPGTATGGPFRAIPTSVPGVHISELLPKTARLMHWISLVRSVNTNENDHGKGRYLITRGRRQEPATNYPHLGAVAAKGLESGDEDLPGYIRITPGGSGTTRDSAYLGPRYDGIVLGNGKGPRNTGRPKSLSTVGDQSRQAFRRGLDESFLLRRRTAATEAYTNSYDQAQRLMERREVFDTSHEPQWLRESYGDHDFGRHCLLARRLLENGVHFVQVNHSNYDTHNENFNFHLEQLGEFDEGFSTLLSDLTGRGLLDSTLVLVLSEFGRTPNINRYYGRDHWGKSWSIALAGCGIQQGAVIGETSKDGKEVVDREVHHGHLFHTYLRAVGLNPKKKFTVGGRKIPLANPADEPIRELLA